MQLTYDTRCYSNVRSKADMSRLNLPHLVIQSVLSFELVVCSVSCQFSKLLVSRRHVRSKEPPRPVGPRPGGEVK